jgi:hypothetical protein
LWECLPPELPAVSQQGGSFSKYPKYQRNQDTDDYHGRYGNIDLDIGSIDNDISRQTAQRNFPQPRPKQTHNDNNDPDND